MFALKSAPEIVVAADDVAALHWLFDMFRRAGRRADDGDRRGL
jgi:hypothetical protein